MLTQDVEQGGGKRWVKVAPEDGGMGLVLARAVGDQTDGVGQQAAGRVGFFLEVTDFEAAHARMIPAGVRFAEAPRTEPYGKIAVFEDLYGNRWDLLEAWEFGFDRRPATDPCGALTHPATPGDRSFGCSRS